MAAPLVLASWAAAGWPIHDEWLSLPFHRWAVSHPKHQGLAPQPKDFRPPDFEAGQRILAGGFVLGGATLAAGLGSDPWDRPSPDHRFVLALCRFGWLRDLLAMGEPGAAEGLRIVL